MIEVASRKYNIGRWQIDCTKMTITNEHESVQLSAKVFELLKLFIVSSDHIVSKDEAIEKVWLNNKGVAKTGFPNALCVLRKIFTDLGAEPNEVFITIPKVGYQLITTAEAIQIESDQTAPDITNSKQKYLWAAVISVAIAFVATYLMINHSKQDKTAIQTVKTQTKAKRITNFEGIEEQPTISPNGQLMAFQWRQTRKHSQIYIKDLSDDSAELRLVSQSDAEEVTPVWSSDGLSLAYIRIYTNGECQVRIYHLISNKDKLVDTGCGQDKFNHGLDWSSDGRYLVYPKVLQGRVAIFRHDLTDNSTKQLTKPNLNQSDSLVVFIEEDQKIAVIRKNNFQSQLFITNANSMDDYVEEVLLKNDNTMLGLAWDARNRQIIVTKPKQGQFVIEAYDLDDKKWFFIDDSPTPGSVSINPASGELVFSRHSASEFIEERSLQTGETLRRIASSSRDLYGQYSNNADSILFNSNRSGSWELWLKNKSGSKQLTNNIGLPFVPTVSPSGEKFAVVFKQPDEDKSQFFIGTLPTGELTKVAEFDLNVTNPFWSQQEDTLFFSASVNSKQGIYSYNIETKMVKNITSSDEIFAVQGSDGYLYMSRTNQSGIWQYNIESDKFIKVVSELTASDYGNYFWMNDALYYIQRSDEYDQIKKLKTSSEDEVVLTLPASSIRNYRGLSPTANQSILISLHGINDADIYAMLLN
ncbi:winged helix-turn-helix domain-containing protein [Thalassotalea psychrophila]|uniref:Winged helix-turn-helix domain-containing protein n=1 Tax=Thalassotalea psychrophila TaxID=3065647 RepID=A0ABY9U4C6_9GAMM|nr:winged helix-turn-helix domain-containing protein [Colwelliaceae bacterium SQ149]